MLKFAAFGCKTFTKMSDIKVKETLAQKLLKNDRKQKMKNEAQEYERASAFKIADIEDVVMDNVKSEYFSPVQTRQQRKTSSNKSMKMHELTNLKLVKKEEKSLAKPLKKSGVTMQKASQAIEAKTKVRAYATTFDAKPESTEWEPEHWQTTLENIRQMRAQNPAPVDAMGCNKCSEADADEKTQRFHILVALMLSSQTKDETTFEAMRRLKTRTLTPYSICCLAVTELEDLLNPVSFYRTKAKHLQLTSRILIDQYNMDIPRSIAELIKLPGVGPKMAHLCMAAAWNEITGIGVDVHVHRISNRLRWLPKETKEPEQTRVALEAWLPRVLWQEVNHLLVGFGQTICTPLRPRCGDCLNQIICPSAQIIASATKTKKPRVKKEQKKIYL